MKNLQKLLFALMLFAIGMNSFAKESKDKSYYVNRYQDPDYLKDNIWSLANDDSEIMEAIEKKYIDVNQKDYTDEYLLNLACEKGNYNLVEYMLSKGAKTSVSGKYGFSPLHHAAYSKTKESLEIVKLLVEKGANVNASSDEGYTPLILAGYNEVNGFEIIKFLVSKKAKINAKTKEGCNVGMACARLLNPEIYKFLAENGFNFNAKDENGYNTLLSFIDSITCPLYDYIDAYLKLLDKKNEITQIIDFLATKTNINSTSKLKQTALHLACNSLIDDTTVIEALIKNGANVNILDVLHRTPIFYCRFAPQMVQVLVDAGTDLYIKDKNGKTYLDILEETVKSHPKESKSVEILKANMGESKKYTFVQLVEYNYTDKALEMLRKGNVNGLDDFDGKGFTPLYYAVWNNNLVLVKELLDKGCDINRRQKNSEATVLSYSVEKMNFEMVQLLLKYKPDLTMKYTNRYFGFESNILLLCVNEYHSYNIVKLLLEAGADPNCIIEHTNPGLTIATYSCSGGADNEVVELIVEYGGNPFATWGYARSELGRSSIISENLHWETKKAIYSGLVKQFKNKTLCTTDNLKLRNQSDHSSPTITVMKKGTKVKVLEADTMESIDGIASCWVRVEVLPGSTDSQGKKIPNGTTGWCFLGYLE